MRKVLLAACAVALSMGGLASLGALPASADPAAAGTASGYGANLDLLGTTAVDQAGLATATLPPGQDVGPNSLLLVPAAPLAVSGTAIGQASAHVNSDLASTLEQNQQPTAGPYNVRGVGLVEDLGVLVGLPQTGISLIEASAVRGEAAGVCRGGTAVYTAGSEIVDLNIAGTDVPLNGPIEGLIDAVNQLLAPLQQIVTIQRNEVTVTGEGATVNALHVTLLPLAGGDPLADLVVGHAQASGLRCGDIPECSDTQDNDGDGVIDAQDPGCINNGVYDPNDDSEQDELPRTAGAVDTGGPALARTGGDQSSAALAVGLAVLAFGALAVRRRSLR